MHRDDGHHSPETMLLLKKAALPTHVESFGLPAQISRRGLMKMLAGASAALAVGLPGCERKPRRQIVSRVLGPEYQHPGTPLYYASTWTEGSFPYGLLIKTVDGRPIKIEGNPDNPVNGGVSSSAMQASILSLYDPDRLRAPLRDGKPVAWTDADREIVEALKGAGSVVVISRSTLGPAERGLIGKFLEACPSARHFVHETVDDRPRRAAWRAIYGEDGEVLPRFDRARTILSLDCDFLGDDGVVLESIGGFARGRMLEDSEHEHAELSRLYVAEGGMTLTGSNADQRIPLPPSAMGALATALLAAVEGDGAGLSVFAVDYHVEPALLESLAEELSGNRGAALVVAGGHLPESVHAAAALLNERLGAPGNTLHWNAAAALPTSDPEEIVGVFEAGVDVAIFLGVNPVYDWAGGGFGELLGRVKLAVGHGLYLDETAAACGVALPSTHNLESWSDASPRAGVSSICQPVIAPLFDARQEAESLLTWTRALADEGDAIHECEDWHAYLKARWQGMLGADDVWEKRLREGGVFSPEAVALPSLDREVAMGLARETHSGGAFEVVIRPHHAVYDGRFASNSWLQELPDAMSKLVWDNAAGMSRQTAEKLGVVEGDLVNVVVGERAVELPVFVQPGMAAGVVSLTLGHGRVGGGRVAVEAGGVNVALLLGREDSGVPRLALNAKVEKSAGMHVLVRTQKQFSMHDRPIVLDGTLDEYRHEADFVKHKRHLPKPADMYDPVDYSKGHKWGLAIDLGACVGCGVCVTACQAENNVAVVGREQCGKGREMHWIRIDRYHVGDPDNPKVHHQPMLCQHCDNAPCENVCPVNATSHSPEGLNEMVYNRCVGTRYCANNCPYKVRRFNFLRYQEARLSDPVQELAFNPQVTVRGVGVMEKCTFCVQRVNEAKFKATNAGGRVVDGDVRTACQQACPAQAIVFGDLNDPESRISKLRSSGRAYHVLEELNIKPNVTYLAKVRNPSVDAKAEPDDHGSGGDHA